MLCVQGTSASDITPTYSGKLTVPSGDRVCGVRLVRAGDEVVLCSESGEVKRLAAASIAVREGWALAGVDRWGWRGWGLGG